MAERPSSPLAVASLRSRGLALAAPARQIARLAAAGGPTFAALAGPVARGPTRVLQINLGRLCNMACRHCHVDAGPDRLDENMDEATALACVAAMDRLPLHTVDLTGGAPELNPNFRTLVEAARARGLHVIDRCNLSVLLLPRFADLPEWLAAHEVEVVASLPHPRRPATDRQRGEGSHDRSLRALRRLQEAGYGTGDPRRRLTLMHNPSGMYLPGPTAELEREYRLSLAEHGLRFDRLLTLNNMPIARFLEWLEERGATAAYLARLQAAFNPATLPGLMCRDTISVAWDGRIHDCDFNQMLDLPTGPGLRVEDLGRVELPPVRTDRHCFGCSAGAGSSCGGALA